MGSSWGRGPGRGSRSGEGSRFGVKVVVKVGGSRTGVKVVGSRSGHDRWSQGRRSRSVVKVRV